RYLIALYGIETIEIREFLQQRAVASADLLTPISHYTASNVLSQLPVVRDRIQIIPNSVDGERFAIRPKPQRLVDRYGLAACRVILTVARLNVAEEKGYDLVIDALPLVIKEVPQ